WGRGVATGRDIEGALAQRGRLENAAVKEYRIGSRARLRRRVPSVRTMAVDENSQMPGDGRVADVRKPHFVQAAPRARLRLGIGAHLWEKPVKNDSASLIGRQRGMLRATDHLPTAAHHCDGMRSRRFRAKEGFLCRTASRPKD